MSNGTHQCSWCSRHCNNDRYFCCDKCRSEYKNQHGIDKGYGPEIKSDPLGAWGWTFLMIGLLLTCITFANKTGTSGTVHFGLLLTSGFLLFSGIWCFICRG